MTKKERDRLIKRRALVLQEVGHLSFNFFGDLYPGSLELDEGALRDGELMFQERKENLLKQLSELNRLLGLPECSREPLEA